MLSFYTGMYMGANGIETDVRLTKDGIAVLFHDEALERVTNASGKVREHTYSELRELDVIKGERKDKIVTLEDFLAHFAHMDITFAIELKGENAEEITAELIHKFGIQSKCVVTSFRFPYLEKMRAVSPDLKLGYLVSSYTEETFAKMKRIGCDEFCPKAALVTEDTVRAWHRDGFRVRAWGVGDEETMERLLACGVDGMTVNFPDKLTERLRK